MYYIHKLLKSRDWPSYMLIWLSVLIGAILLFLGSGCSSSPSLEQQTERSERDITNLKRSAEKIRQSAIESKKSLGEQLVKVDEIITKIDALLGNKTPIKPDNPKPVVPDNPKPDNPKPDNPKPDNPKPVVPDNPSPPVNPEPEGPKDGRFGVAQAVWKMAKVIASPDLKREATDLAGAFASIATQLERLDALTAKKAAGTKLTSDEQKEYSSLNDRLGPGLFGDDGSEVQEVKLGVKPQWMKISDELSKLNRPIITKNLKVWEGPANTLGSEIGKFYKAGKLSKNIDWADLFNEIALGLRSV